MSNKQQIFSKAFNDSCEQQRITRHHITDPFLVQSLPSTQLTESHPSDLWQGIWAHGEMACLFGTSCVGKSILAMQIDKELQEKGLTTIYFNLENSTYPVQPLVNTCSPPEANLSPDARIEFIAQEIADQKPQAVFIDDISFLVDNKNHYGMLLALNRLRVICQHSGTAMLLIAHSRKRKSTDLTTPEELLHQYDIMHACDSVFSLATTSRWNSTSRHTTHYIKQHKNRMAPVILDDEAVISAQLITSHDGNLIFSNLQRNESEHSLVRDNGFRSREEQYDAIAHYRKLAYSTREIAAIVGLSQAQVSRIAKCLSQDLFISHSFTRPQQCDASDSYDSCHSSSAFNPSDTLKATDASDSCHSSPSSGNDVQELSDTVAHKISRRWPNSNSSVKKLMKKSRRNKLTSSAQ